MHGAEEAAKPAGLPEEFRVRILAVTASFNTPQDAARLTEASVEAERLDQELTDRYGPRHPHTINIRELRGWLALVKGQPGDAARWYLHTTGLQTILYGPDHANTQGSVRRAIHAWQQVNDSAEVVQIGGNLAKAAAAVLGEGSDAARFIQARLSRRQQS
ncbi:hypothetical protein EES39_38615 [Streptomyces sp. ADI92-24]|uniref:hypothetical protein n=1 Tax=Streptomyces sp. ADI92-24 TaxID=1522756 RepID=UPI000F54D7A2|nr:hypothetical protein [Streptomyces sp. ADI92-24]RPK32403.1 hypothetical protein EES39_38615 [Streptomyces sp. ADI92-24]